MIRFKDISIPKPCSVNYDSLPYNEVKRFCGSCEKHVYDFRGKDETYLNKILLHEPDTCGIFYMDELNIYKGIPVKKHLYKINLQSFHIQT